jgi:hypothetical protein
VALPREEREVCDDSDLGESLGQCECIEFQSVSAASPKPDFEHVEHSVYEGRQRLGRYERIAPACYAAYDAEDRPLGGSRGHGPRMLRLSGARNERALCERCSDL